MISTPLPTQHTDRAGIRNAPSLSQDDAKKLEPYRLKDVFAPHSDLPGKTPLPAWREQSLSESLAASRLALARESGLLGALRLRISRALIRAGLLVTTCGLRLGGMQTTQACLVMRGQSYGANVMSRAEPARYSE